MIRFSQSQDDVNTLFNSYPENAMQRQIITRLQLSNKPYIYKNNNQLKFYIDLRAQIINAAYAQSNSGLDFAVFRKTRCNEEYWIRENNGGFRLKRGVKPSQAISDIFRNASKYATECATAMVIVYYMALLQVFPQELFDKVFDNIYLMNWHDIDRNLREIGMMKELSDSLPGDRRYFKNPDVDVKTPEWQGENVIDLGNGQYYGHGVGIYKAEQIIRALNENRKQGSTVSAYLMDTAGNPDYDKLYSIFERNQTQGSSSLTA